jgi:hypothetical protein
MSEWWAFLKEANRYSALHWQPLAEEMNRSDAPARLLVDVLGSAFYSIFSS